MDDTGAASEFEWLLQNTGWIQWPDTKRGWLDALSFVRSYFPNNASAASWLGIPPAHFTHARRGKAGPTVRAALAAKGLLKPRYGGRVHLAVWMKPEEREELIEFLRERGLGRREFILDAMRNSKVGEALRIMASDFLEER
jgi:hypothetical protein